MPGEGKIIDVNTITVYGQIANCKEGELIVGEPKYVKQEPYVDEKGIYVPVNEYVQEGQASYYRCIMSKELFVEAYNKYIEDR